MAPRKSEFVGEIEVTHAGGGHTTEEVMGDDGAFGALKKLPGRPIVLAAVCVTSIKPAEDGTDRIATRTANLVMTRMDAIPRDLMAAALTGLKQEIEDKIREIRES